METAAHPLFTPRKRCAVHKSSARTTRASPHRCGEDRSVEIVFSLGEQQLLAVARVLIAAPLFVFLDRVGTALDSEHVALVLKVLSDNGITHMVSNGGGGDARHYDAILDVAGDGAWQWKSLREPHPSEPESSGGREPLAKRPR